MKRGYTLLWRKVWNSPVLRATGAVPLTYRRCDCISLKIRAGKLSVIPSLFRDSTFDSYKPKDNRQSQALAAMRSNPDGSFYLTGPYGSGMTHLLYAQYRRLALETGIRCHVRTTRELTQELTRAELKDDFISPVMAAASGTGPYHLFWDDIDKIKPTEFRMEVLFELLDRLYRNMHGITITGNHSLRDLVEQDRMLPAIVRRVDVSCTVIAL
jgi:DNA replication protein DnaC